MKSYTLVPWPTCRTKAGMLKVGKLLRFMGTCSTASTSGGSVYFVMILNPKPATSAVQSPIGRTTGHSDELHKDRQCRHEVVWRIRKNALVSGHEHLDCPASSG